ncbi:MAG: helix-turn-helix domain-containing protein [Bryobacterales bacterium]|nr:helix-turn-helix domain-containing protein [Bryobacterales bacterium]
MPAVVDEKKYGRLLARHVPSVIETDKEHDRLAEVLLGLTVPVRPRAPEEQRLAALIGRLVDDYEERQTAHAARRYSPAGRLRMLMDSAGLRQNDLADVFGSQSNVSEVLAGKRAINLDHARRLAKRFHMKVEYFI